MVCLQNGKLSPSDRNAVIAFALQDETRVWATDPDAAAVVTDAIDSQGPGHPRYEPVVEIGQYPQCRTDCDNKVLLKRSEK